MSHNFERMVEPGRIEDILSKSENGRKFIAESKPVKINLDKYKSDGNPAKTEEKSENRTYEYNDPRFERTPTRIVDYHKNGDVVERDYEISSNGESEIKRKTQRYPDGSKVVSNYENGKVTSEERVDKNGDKETTYFDEKGRITRTEHSNTDSGKTNEISKRSPAKPDTILGVPRYAIENIYDNAQSKDIEKTVKGGLLEKLGVNAESVSLTEQSQQRQQRGSQRS